MFDSQQVARTEQRYKSRHSEWVETEATIKAGAVLGLDTPERLRLRLRRRGMSPSQAHEVMEGEAGLARDFAAVPAAGTPVLNVLERIIGKSNLIEASFLTEGPRPCEVSVASRSLIPEGSGPGMEPGSWCLRGCS